jgi:hypothetical protein
MLLKSFWSEANLKALRKAYEDRASRSDSLEDLEAEMQALADEQGFGDITMDGIRWQIRKLRRAGKILMYQDYVTGEDVDVMAKGKPGTTSIEYTEDEDGNPQVVMQGMGDVPVSTLQELLDEAIAKGCPDDLERFKVSAYKRRTWTTPMKVGNAEEGFRSELVRNFYVAASFGLAKPIEALRDVAGEILQEISLAGHGTPPAPKPDVNPCRRPVMFQPSVVDVHLGNLVWGKESGEDWDMKIAKSIFTQTVESLIAHAQAIQGTQIAEIIWLVGNDFMHADGKTAQTTGGTQLDLDTRWQKMFGTAWRLQKWAIDRLRQIAPVKAIVIPGNHDELSAFALGEVLGALFEHVPDVTIDNSPKLRKYHMCGSTLIGYTHGSNEKLQQLPALMHADRQARPYLSDAEFKEFHVGHFHHRKGLKFLPAYEDHNGVLVRVLPTVTATDDWHFAKGFVGAVKAAEGYIYDYEDGLIHVVHSQRKVVIQDDN